MTQELQNKLIDVSARLSTWLNEEALPLWRTRGFLGETGGFCETMELSGEPSLAPRRSRVPPRQIFCFAEAGARGWAGDWQTAVSQGFTYYERVYRLPNGFYGALASVDGVLLDDSFDLYNQAFALLAYAHTARAMPERAQEMAKNASDMLSALKAGYAHAEAGFEEAIPSRLPLCSNPHMHLFEAALACEAQSGFDEKAWASLSDEIAQLCMRRFIDADTGGLREFFAADWTPYGGIKGRIMEPGHQFEWAWLLARWAERRANPQALEKARRLFAIGEDHGICPQRRVAVMALLDDFSVHDPLARLWPQTEWLKSAVRLAALSTGEERNHYLASALVAADALGQFMNVTVAGLWRDKLSADGRFVEEPAPASSFYHILCAIYEVEDCLARLS
ncbi:AGE family epimerase/isomerase [Rhizobium sp. FY34]|uniref:AGE family epimerase/isomerase n=1 Tax=Rhizobium sp. FY34 TaxID=2562309 RepID=UPI0010C01C2B|nr:AGE family epimerase/isomerase [Rhizobium sp. FY34]